MRNSASHRNFLNIVCTFIALILLIYFCLLHESVFSLLFVYNSDIITLPYFYKDLFFHGGSITQWLFPATMCFFPDTFLYFILAFLSGNLKLAIVFFAIFQFVFYYLLIVEIGKRIINDHESVDLFRLSVFLSFVLYAGGYLGQDIFYAPTFYGHFGAALMFLLGLFLIIRSFSNQGKLNFVFLAIICFLTVYSDVLFITQFVITAIISLYVMSLLLKEVKKNCKKNIFVIAISSFFSFLFYIFSKYIFHIHIFIDHHYLKRYRLSELISATKKIIYKLSQFYQSNAIIVLLLFIYFFVTIAVLVKVVGNRFRNEEVLNEEAPFLFTIIMLFMSIIIGYLSLIFLDNNLMSSDPSLRHFQPFVLFPVFLGIPLYLVRYTNIGKLVAKYYVYLIVPLVFCTFLFAPKGSITNLVKFYPPQAACIDQYAHRYHLKNGLAGYWDAKYLSFLSRQNVNIAAITKNNKTIIPYIWFDTIHDYLNKDFNFVLVKNNPNEFPNRKDVESAYGLPLYTLKCQTWADNDSSTIYVYKNGKIRFSSDVLNRLLQTENFKKFLLRLEHRFKKWIRSANFIKKYIHF